jgi:2-amino-4-ketopentanoate thiolase beta subunit
MSSDISYTGVMKRRNQIMKRAIGIDFDQFETGSLGFNYEQMMEQTGYTLQQMQKIQLAYGVGNTPVLELRNLTRLARQFAQEGKGATLVIKDEAANPSGSFKDRRAANAVYNARKNGYKGVIAATSGNYGAAVASQAAMQGLKCIVVQECYDSRKIGQPEIIEKARKCEAFGAEVVQLTVGPELFYTFLLLLEETGYFNASLYTPFGIGGVETLGWELVHQVREKFNRDPDMVVCTNAGGGNLTGTARGILKADATATQIVGASVDLRGLHMASDSDFNRKSFTTGHTGFGIPFAVWPDRSDVPRSAARPLRYMDRYVTVTQGEVFYMTEALARLEGLERGPAGNISLAAAFSLAQELEQNQIVVIQETEYTGAGKHLQPQLSFARDNNIEISFGDPEDEIPGKNIILPDHPQKIRSKEIDLDRIRRSFIRKSVEIFGSSDISSIDREFLATECKTDTSWVETVLSV